MWFRSLFDSCVSRRSRTNVAQKGRSRVGRRWPARLEVEFLEERCLLSAVHAMFDLGSTAGGAFPSDRFTLADTTQNTGRRVDLPLPNPATHLSDYQDTQVLNTLDGFNLQPRLSIPFDGLIDVNTVTSNTVFLVSMGDTLNPHDHGGQVVGINQIVWDPATTTLHVESDASLDQHTRYVLIVTSGVHDDTGHPVEATLAFRLAPLTLPFSPDRVLRNYGGEMVEGLVAAYRAGVRPQDIVTASVFTTESATAVLEKIRDQIHAATPDAADFNLGPDGARTVFSLDQVTGITFNEQTHVDPLAPLTSVSLAANLAGLNSIPGAVSEIAFGKYVSPDYEVHPGEYIPAVGTRTGTPAVQGYNDIYFDLFLPSGQMPQGGWPVAIYGHGNGGSRNDSFLIAATLAEHGIATIAISAVGHDFGPLGTMTLSQTEGSQVTFSAGGRGRDQDNDGTISNNEGLSTPAPRSLLFFSDAIRQTAADLMQLVRVIETGVDVHGNGQTDLDPSRIYYVGQSLGANYGTVLLGVEPDVHAGVVSAVGDPTANRQLNAGRNGLGSLLQSRTPSLLNSPGITVLGGLNESAPYFDENMPLRDGTPLTVTLADGTTRTIQSPVTNTVAGAMAIQEVVDNIYWATQPGDPVAYAPHLRKAPLPGVPAKSVIVQFNKGDQSAPDPNATAMIRAGDLTDRTSYYRHDVAHAADPTIPNNPHQFLLGLPVTASPLETVVEAAKQRQVANFFASDGQFIDDLADVTTPDGTPLFEVPIQGPLPEDLNYIITASPSPSRATAPARGAEGSTGTSGATVGQAFEPDSQARKPDLPWTYGQQLRVNDRTADNDGATSGNLTLAPGEASETITVPVQSSKKKEADETFYLPLWEAGSAILPDPQGIGTIHDANGLSVKH
jgi:dienelactone hydrolase